MFCLLEWWSVREASILCEYMCPCCCLFLDCAGHSEPMTNPLKRIIQKQGGGHRVHVLHAYCESAAKLLRVTLPTGTLRTYENDRSTFKPGQIKVQFVDSRLIKLAQFIHL
jgi:hypothetical protein